VVSAAMQFDERLSQMPALFERTKQIYKIIGLCCVIRWN